MENSIFAQKNKIIMGIDKPVKTDKTTNGKDSTPVAATPEKKKFKLHRMTKEELLETRIPVYDYIL